MDKDRYTVIIDGVRSLMGAKRGKLKGVRSDELTAQVMRGLLERNSNFPVEKVDDVVLGCAFPEAEQGGLLARYAAVLAGIPKEAGAKVVNRFCGSSMDAVHQAAASRGRGFRRPGQGDGQDLGRPGHARHFLTGHYWLGALNVTVSPRAGGVKGTYRSPSGCILLKKSKRRSALNLCTSTNS